MDGHGAVRVAVFFLVAGFGTPGHPAETVEVLAEQVRVHETAFANTMAERDITAFGLFVSEEALFLGPTVLRGRDAVVEGWRRFFEGEEAPFSWTPERVLVLESGSLAISTGPVLDPDGQRIGTFTSTWRRESDSHWRVVLDSGCPPCDCTGTDGEKPGPSGP